MARASFCGPSQAATSRGCPWANLAVDRVAGHDRIVDQQAQGDDHGGDRNLLQIDAQQLADAQRHGQVSGMETATSRALRHSMKISGHQDHDR